LVIVLEVEDVEDVVVFKLAPTFVNWLPRGMRILSATCFVFPDPRILLEAVLVVEDLDDVVVFKLAATFAN
jgi:hypothetical protein